MLAFVKELVKDSKYLAKDEAMFAFQDVASFHHQRVKGLERFASASHRNNYPAGIPRHRRARTTTDHRPAARSRRQISAEQFQSLTPVIHVPVAVTKGRPRKVQKVAEKDAKSTAADGPAAAPIDVTVSDEEVVVHIKAE
jgi:hypothetical protein